MKKEAYLHIAYHSKNSEILFVKVTRYTEKAHLTQCDNALIQIGHNDFNFVSFPCELKEIKTKPFKDYFLGSGYSWLRDIEEEIKTLIKYEDL